MAEKLHFVRMEPLISRGLSHLPEGVILFLPGIKFDLNFQCSAVDFSLVLAWFKSIVRSAGVNGVKCYSVKLISYFFSLESEGSNITFTAKK